MAKKKILTISERAVISLKVRKVRKILPIIISLLGTVILTGYISASMYSKFGSFTISVNKSNSAEYGIALSETKDFIAAPLLKCKQNKDITNIAGENLDESKLGLVDGSDNGLNYLCYTFYLKNTGKKILSYTERIIIKTASLDVDKAARVRVYSARNEGARSYVDYAYGASVDEQTGNTIPEPGTVAFVSNSIVCKNKIPDFDVGDVMKYTIVIWLEGNDPDCEDRIIGGEFKIDMEFSIDGISELEN